MRSLLASLAVVALVVVIAPAAEAKRYAHSDGAGDMHSLLDQERAADAPDQTLGDITRVELRNDKRFVRVYMTFRALRMPEAAGLSVYVNVENGRHQLRQLSMGVGSNPNSVTIVRVSNGAYKSVRCRGHRSGIVNPSTRVLAMKVPRNCFNNPKIIRLNANSQSGYNSDVHTTYVDDALTAGYPSNPFNFQSPVVWSPWVKRG